MRISYRMKGKTAGETDVIRDGADEEVGMIRIALADGQGFLIEAYPKFGIAGLHITALENERMTVLVEHRNELILIDGRRVGIAEKELTDAKLDKVVERTRARFLERGGRQDNP